MLTLMVLGPALDRGNGVDPFNERRGQILLRQLPRLSGPPLRVRPQVGSGSEIRESERIRQGSRDQVLRLRFLVRRSVLQVRREGSVYRMLSVGKLVMLMSRHGRG
jgi:hypothetical protein